MSKAPQDGNGAREAVQRYFDEFGHTDMVNSTDHFLIWLGAEGFIIVPMEAMQ